MPDVAETRRCQCHRLGAPWFADVSVTDVIEAAVACIHCQSAHVAVFIDKPEPPAPREPTTWDDGAMDAD